MATVLIALLATAPTELAWQAEELLYWVAGDDAPDLAIGAGKTDVRKQCQMAWENWWRVNDAKLDWDKVRRDHRRPGLLLAAGYTPESFEDQRKDLLHHVWLIGCNGKSRWKLSERLPERHEISAVQLLAGGRIHLGQTERDLDGKVLWERTGTFVTSARRLPNGNTFVQLGNSSTVEEVTPEGAAVYSHSRKDPKVAGSPMLRGEVHMERMNNGRIVAVTGMAKCG
ncbi:MAG: hypothetical protein K2R98_29095 [Gemmataceae bacterium]|nr:hypothetical protein [Gemmataceae bacterium]